MSSRWPHRSRMAAADLAPHPGSPGNPSAASPTSASRSGIELGHHAEALAHPRRVEPLVLAAVPLPDLAADALAEVLVRRADDDPLHEVIRRRDLGARRQRVVGLLLDHRPHREARGPQRVLDPVELVPQVAVDA